MCVALHYNRNKEEAQPLYLMQGNLCVHRNNTEKRSAMRTNACAAQTSIFICKGLLDVQGNRASFRKLILVITITQTGTSRIPLLQCIFLPIYYIPNLYSSISFIISTNVQ